MTEPIVSREAIALQAEGAAQQQIRTGLVAQNPYAEGTDAHAAWAASLARHLLVLASPDGESSA